jgi:orotidine-5'-phosphate decarboxylase
MSDFRNPLIVAIDTADIMKATFLVASLTPYVGMFKFGLEFFTACGTAGIRETTGGIAPFMLDLKLHDIPGTVAAAVKAALPLRPRFITVHASGSCDMIDAAVLASGKSNDRPLIIAVTVLTSLDDLRLSAVGMERRYGSDFDSLVEEKVYQLAEMAIDCGADGLVCSPLEVKMLQKMRECFEKKFILICPGVRPDGSASGDQFRIATPRESLDAGADWIIVGRPITQAPDPVAACKVILEGIR